MIKKKIIDKLENLPELNSLNHYHKYDGSFDYDVCVNFCWAAILLLNNKIIKKTGLFDKKFFIFWEDFYLCRKFKKKESLLLKFLIRKLFIKLNRRLEKQ